MSVDHDLQDVSILKARVKAGLEEVEANRLLLHQAIRNARRSGASIASLMALSGYSRRRVFQILSETKAS